MPTVDHHPSRQELEAFALGQLDVVATASIEEHLCSCSGCQEVVAQTPGDAFTALLQSAHSMSETIKAEITSAGTVAEEKSRLASPTGITAVWGQGEKDSAVEIPPALVDHPRYHLQRLLGFGGMGSVWLAEHRVMGRKVAVKMIRPEFLTKPKAVERFQREAQAAARLHHPNIVAAYDAEQAGDTHLLVMEYIEGVSLVEYLRQHGALPLQEACEFIHQAALGLQHAHNSGLIHRDLKPHNLMLAKDSTVKILDFGLSALTDVRQKSGLTGENMVVGTPDYIAPEQAEDPRSADIRSDIYSLGCTFYHLLAGRVPFPQESVLNKLFAHRSLEPESLTKLRPEVPPALAAIIAKMMAKDPVARYQTPAEVAAALEEYGRAGDVNGPVEEEPHPQPRSSRRSRWPLVTAGVLALGLALAAAGVVYRIQTAEGEVVITPESPDVEIVLLKGGKEIQVIDTKTNKRVTVPVGTYDVAVKDKPEGIEIKTDRIVISRGKETLVVISRLAKPGPASTESPIKDIEPLHRIRWADGHKWFGQVSPDGRYFLAVRHDTEKCIRVWDTQNGKLVFERENGWMARFTPDSKQVITCEHFSDLNIYDLATGRKVRDFDTQHQMYNFATAHAGPRLLYIAPDEVQIWDWVAGKQLCQVRWKETERVYLAEGGKYLLHQADPKPPLRVFDAATGKEVEGYQHLRDLPTLIGVGGNPDRILCKDDRHLKVYDLAQGKLLASIDGGSSATGTISGDGRRVLATTNQRDELRLWDVASGKALANLRCPEEVGGPGLFLSLSHDGRHAVVGGVGDSVFVYRLPDPAPAEKVGEVRQFVPHDTQVMAVAFSPDGRLGVSAPAIGPEDGDASLKLLDLMTGKEVRRFEGHRSSVYGVAFSPDGKRIVSGGGYVDTSVRVWDVATGKETQRFDAEALAFAVAFLPDGKTVVSAGEGGIVYVWDVETGKEVKRLERHTAHVRGLTVSVDGRYVATAGGEEDSTVRVWDLEKGTEIKKFTGHTDQVNSVTFTSDGKWLASAGCDGTVRLWDLKESKEVRQFEGHTKRVDGLCFTPDGRRLLTGGNDRTLRLWDVASGKELYRFTNHTGFIWCAKVSPDGQYALSSSADGTVRLWRLPDSTVAEKP